MDAIFSEDIGQELRGVKRTSDARSGDAVKRHFVLIFGDGRRLIEANEGRSLLQRSNSPQRRSERGEHSLKYKRRRWRPACKKGQPETSSAGGRGHSGSCGKGRVASAK